MRRVRSDSGFELRVQSSEFWFLVFSLLTRNQELEECNDEIASPVREVLLGRPSSRRAIVGARRGGHGGPPVQVTSEVFLTSH